MTKRKKPPSQRSEDFTVVAITRQQHDQLLAIKEKKPLPIKSQIKLALDWWAAKKFQLCG